MWCGNKRIIGIMILLILAVFIAKTQATKSVFIISKHSIPSQAQAYKIDGDQVTYQAQVGIDTYNPGYGAVGNAVWSGKELMFVTYENSPIIVWASTKTLKKAGEFDTAVTSLAGIAVDEGKGKIYVVKRAYDDLYIYSLDEEKNKLVLEGHHHLQVPFGYMYAWGIALDETNNLLYVSTDTARVHVYKTADFSHDHYIDIDVNGISRSAVGIAIDPLRGYLYTGHWQYHSCLVRTITSSPYTSIEVEVERQSSSQPVIGIGVDQDTGLVYCTTYHNDFRVYDSNLVLKDSETYAISGPAGVAVPRRDVSYKPPFPYLTLVKDDNDVNCVSPLISDIEHELLETPYNWLYYNIHYDANGHADTNIILTDHLPHEVDYYSSDPCGLYDANERTKNVCNAGETIDLQKRTHVKGSNYDIML